MKEDPAERTANYLEKTSEALKRLRTRDFPASVTAKMVDHVIELVHGYAKDARHYVENKKPVTSLACIAYAEGLLDALKFLDLIDI